MPGYNSCKVVIDGEEYANRERTFNYNFSQRYIALFDDLNNNRKVDIREEIQVIFPEGESGEKQADEFNGILLNEK